MTINQNMANEADARTRARIIQIFRHKHNPIHVRHEPLTNIPGGLDYKARNTEYFADEKWTCETFILYIIVYDLIRVHQKRVIWNRRRNTKR